MSGERAMTLRIPTADYEALVVVARAGGRPVSVEIREAVAGYVAARKADPSFAAEARRVADGWVRFADSCADRTTE